MVEVLGEEATTQVISDASVWFARSRCEVPDIGGVRNVFTQQALRSQKRCYPADFVWSVERSRNTEVSLVFDECAVNKFYYAEELPDPKP